MTHPSQESEMREQHVHAFEVYGDHGPLDYGDELAEWCAGCGRSRRDIETPDIDPRPLSADEVGSLRTFVGPSHADSPGGPIAWVPWPTWERIIVTLAAREQAATEVRRELVAKVEALPSGATLQRPFAIDSLVSRADVIRLVEASELSSRAADIPGLDAEVLARAIQWIETPIGALLPPLQPFWDRAVVIAAEYRRLIEAEESR